MTTVQLQFDDDLIAVLGALNQPLEQSARELMVMELFRRGAISSGKAAQLLGIARHEFLDQAAGVGLSSLDQSDEQWHDERAASERI